MKLEALIPAFLLALLNMCAAPTPSTETLVCVEWQPFVTSDEAASKVLNERVSHWDCVAYEWQPKERD